MFKAMRVRCPQCCNNGVVPTYNDMTTEDRGNIVKGMLDIDRIRPWFKFYKLDLITLKV